MKYIKYKKSINGKKIKVRFMIVRVEGDFVRIIKVWDCKFVYKDLGKRYYFVIKIK